MNRDELHPEFLELCALSTSTSLTEKERTKLDAHLAVCESCRKAKADYEAVVDQVLPQIWLDTDSGDRAQASVRSDHAVEDSAADPPQDDDWRILEDVDDGSEHEDWLDLPIQIPQDGNPWRPLWWQFAAGLLLVAALGLSAYKLGMHHGFESAFLDRRMMPEQQFSPPKGGPDGNVELATAQQRGRQSEAAVLELKKKLQEQSQRVEELEQRSENAEAAFKVSQSDLTRLAQEEAALRADLESSQSALESQRQLLSRSSSQDTQSATRVASLESRVQDLTQAVNDRNRDLAEKQELLDHDRDIRELMGARDLYIAEIYDVGKNGETQKPYGRVFYTQGKSLVFYAYDLDQQAAMKNVGAFQAWGRRGPDRAHAVNLGILYEDSTAKRRWVVKSDDPKTLAQIDAVFVTVEPNGGSTHPSGKPLLFAYLRMNPNHP